MAGQPADRAAISALGGQNLLDKAIAYVSPQLAAKRLLARTQLAVSGSYTGARIDRAQLSRWLPTARSANSDTLADLPMLRARSRDQMRNAPVAVGALNQTVSNVVGSGLSHSATIDHEYLGLTEEEADAWQTEADRRFSAWCDSIDCHLERQLNFYGLQEIAFRSELESGDVFVLTPRVPRAGAPVRLALQLIEADRVCNPDRKADTALLMDGIELSPSTGEALAAYVSRKHPNDPGPTAWDRVAFRGSATGRRNVLHCFTPLRPGQVRGVPWIAPILEPLKQLSRWSEAELNAAVTSSIFSVFIKMDPEAFQDVFDETAQGQIVNQASQWSGAMESGKAINLLPGEDVVTTTPGRPNPQFDPFWTAIVRQIGMAIEMPFEVLIMHFQSSYTAARGALLMAWRVWRRRRDRMVTNLCQPVYELWLTDEVAEGRIAAPGFFADPMLRASWSAGVWTGDGPGSIDPQKEVGAAADRVALEISTLEAESILHDGISWKTKHRQRVKELNAQRADGTLTPQPGAATALPPANQADDGNDNEDDQGPPPRGKPDAQLLQALATMSERMGALASEPRSITVNSPPVTVNQGDTHHHIAPSPVAVRNEVNVPQANVTVEAFMPEQRSEAPVVNVTNQVQPAAVVVNNAFAKKATQVVERDANDEITQTVTTFES